MEVNSTHEIYHKELERICEKHRTELDEIEKRHRDEIRRIFTENNIEISKLKQNLRSEYQKELKKIKEIHEQEIEELRNQFESHVNGFKDCDLDMLTKRIEEDITKTQAKHKKIVSYLINEIYKLKKTIINSSFNDVEKPVSLDSIDIKNYRDVSIQDTDIETSDYVLSQDSIDTNIKDLEDIIQERDDLRSVAMTLRQLTKYLCAFLIDQQEELNNSIVEHINDMKCGGITKSGSGDNCDINSSSEFRIAENESKSPRRVHFVPNIEEIVSLIDENTILADFTNIEPTVDTSSQVRSELNACLEKLKEETTTLSEFSIKEPKVLCPNSEIICQKSFIENKLQYYITELNKQKFDYEQLLIKYSELEHENDTMKKQLDSEVSSISSNKICNDIIENNNLISLYQKVQEIIKNCENWSPLQSVLEQYFAECGKMIDELKNEKEELIQQLSTADNRLQSLNTFLKDQTLEREYEREQYDIETKKLREQLKDKERESLGSENLKTHTEMLVNEHHEAEERYIDLKTKHKKIEELLKSAEKEIKSLKETIFSLEDRIDTLVKNEISDKNYIESLTNIIQEEQSNQQDMLQELNRLRSLFEEQNQTDTSEFIDTEIIINNIRIQLKDLEKSVSKRIKELDLYWVTDECNSPASEDISVAERCELRNNISLEKNSSPNRIVASLDDVFMRIQERLNRLFKSEEAILKHESDQNLSTKQLNKQIKDLESEVNILRTRLAEKNDQLTTAKMKIDDLRLIKNSDVDSATSLLHDTIAKLTAEHKQCTLAIEDKNNEITKLNDLTNHLKNMLSTYESKLVEKENIDPNTIKSLESKVVKLVEENMNLQLETASKISQIKILEDKIHDFQSKEQDENVEILVNPNFSKSMTDSQSSENEQMRRAIPNDSNTLALLQFSHQHQNVSIQEPSIINFSFPSPQLKDRTNIYTTMNDDMKLLLTNTKMELEEKNAVIKVMEKDTEFMENRIKTLEEDIKLLYSDKTSLEQHIESLKENENVLTNKLYNALSEIEKKQETLKELETLGVKLRAEIQPLEYMKNTLEKKLESFKEYNKIQSEKIECLESINNELLNEYNILKEDQKILEHTKSLKEENTNLKNELLKTENFKIELSEKIEKLNYEYEQLKNENIKLKEKIEDLKLNNIHTKNELKKVEELHENELQGYRNLLAETQEQKHKMNMDFLKQIEDLTSHTEDHKLLMAHLKNKDYEITNTTFSDLDSDKTSPDLVNNSMTVLEKNLEYERKKNNELKHEIENNEVEINHLKKYQEEKIAELSKKVLVEINLNADLKINIIKMESYIKDLESKINDEKTNKEENHIIEKLNQQLRDVMNKFKILEQELSETIDLNEKLDSELNRILDIKEEMDQKLAEAYRKIDELISSENKNSVLMKQLESQNLAIGHLKQQLESAEEVLLDQKTRAEQDNQVFKLKVLELQKQLKQYEQKYHEISKDYETLKLSRIQDTDIDLQIQLEKTEKEVIELQKKYNDSLYENRNIQNKLESLDAEFQHLQNKMYEMQNKLFLTEYDKDKLKSDIKDFTLPEELKQRQSSLIINLEVENAKLTSKVIEYREKYNKLKAYIEEVKSMITSQNIKKVLEDNIDLCKTKKTLQKQVIDLQSYAKELNNKLSEKSAKCGSAVSNRHNFHLESHYYSLVWQKMYLVKLAGGKDKLLRLIIPEIEDGLLKSTMQKICGKRKMSKFKILVICVIAVRRMKMTAERYAGNQLDKTYYNLPKKMPWIKC